MRNKHRKKLEFFLQEGGATPVRRPTRGQEALGENGATARDAATRARLIKDQLNLNRANGDTAAKRGIAAIAADKLRRNNTKEPLHEAEIDAGIAKHTRDIEKQIAQENEVSKRKLIDKINEDANNNIAKVASDLKARTNAQKDAEAVLKNVQIPIKPTPAQEVAYRAQLFSANSRLNAIKKSVQSTQAKIIALNTERVNTIKLFTDKAIIKNAIYGWRRVASDMRVVAPLIHNAIRSSNDNHGRAIIDGNGAPIKATTDLAFHKTAVENTTLSIRANTVKILTLGSDSVTVNRQIIENKGIVNTLTTENTNFRDQINNINIRITARSEAMPGLLRRSLELQTAHDNAVAARKTLEDALKDLNPPDPTQRLELQANINKRISEAAKNIDLIKSDLSKIGRDILVSAGARDFLIAQKAEAEGGILAGLLQKISGSDTDLISSRNNRDSEQIMNDSITKALQDIANTMKPHTDADTILRDLVADIGSYIKNTLGNKLTDAGDAVRHKNIERIENIKLVEGYIKLNANGIIIINHINDTIRDLLILDTTIQTTSDKLQQALIDVGGLKLSQTTLDTATNSYNIILKAINDSMTNDIGPSLVIANSEIGIANRAHTDAYNNHKSVNDGIALKNEAYKALIHIQEGLISSIAIRSSSIRKVLHDANISNANANIVSSNRASLDARNNMQQNRGGFTNKLNSLKTADLLTVQTKRTTLDGTISPGGIVYNSYTKAQTDSGINGPLARNANGELQVLGPKLKPNADKITSETTQSLTIGDQIKNVPPPPSSLPMPSINPPPIPLRADAEKLQLSNTHVPDADATPITTAQVAKDAAISDAKTDLGNNPTVALADATAIANGIHPDGMNPLTNGTRDTVTTADSANRITSSDLDSVTGQLTNKGTELSTAETGAIKSDGDVTSLNTDVNGIYNSLENRYNDIPAHRDPPSDSAAMIEARIIKPGLDAGLDTANTNIITNNTDSGNNKTHIKELIQDINTFIITTLADSNALVQRLNLDIPVQSAVLNTASSNLTNATNLNNTLQGSRDASIINKAELTQSLSDLGNLFSTHGSREAMRIKATGGSSSFSIARGFAHGYRLSATNSPSANTGFSSAIRGKINGINGNINKGSEISGYKKVASDANETATIRLGEINIADATGNVIKTKILIEGIDTQVTIVKDNIKSEGAQSDKITGELLANGPRPDTPQTPDTGRINDANDGVNQSRDAKQTAENAMPHDIPLADRTPVTDAEAAKIKAIEDAKKPPDVNPETGLKIAKDIAATIDSTAQRDAHTTTTRDVDSTTGAEGTARTRLDTDSNTLLNDKGPAVEGAKGLNDLARQALLDADPVPFESAVALREGDIPPHMDPPIHQTPPKNPADLAGDLGGSFANINKYRISKDLNDADITRTNTNIDGILIKIDTNEGPNIANDILINGLPKVTNAESDLSITQGRLNDARTRQDGLITSLKNTNTSLKVLNNQLISRVNLKSLLDSANGHSKMYVELHNSTNALRTGMANRPIHGDNGGAKRGIALLTSIVQSIKSKRAQNLTLDGNLTNVKRSLTNAEGDHTNAKRDGDNDLTNISRIDTQVTIVKDNIKSEGAQAAKITGELLANGPRPDTPQTPDTGPINDANDGVNQSRDAKQTAENAMPHDIPLADITPVTDAEAAKMRAIEDATKPPDVNPETGLKIAKDIAATIDSTAQRDAHTTTTRDVDSTTGAEGTARTRLDTDSNTLHNDKGPAVEGAKGIYDKVKDALRRIVDAFTSAVESVTRRRSDIPETVNRPDVPVTDSTLLTHLTETFNKLKDAIKNKGDIDGAIKDVLKLIDGDAGLKSKIIKALENVDNASNDVTGAFKMLQNLSGILSGNKSRIHTLNDAKNAGLKRSGNLKKLHDALGSYSDVMLARSIQRALTKGDSDAFIRARDDAKTKRDLAENTPDKSDKDGIKRKMDQLDAKTKQLNDRIKLRKDAGDKNIGADADIIRLLKLKKDLTESLFGENMRKLAKTNDELLNAKRKLSDLDDAIKALEALIRELKRRVGDDDPAAIRDAEELLRKLKEKRDKLNDDINAKKSKIKKLQDDITKLKNDMDALNRLKNSLKKDGDGDGDGDNVKKKPDPPGLLGLAGLILGPVALGASIAMFAPALTNFIMPGSQNKDTPPDKDDTDNDYNLGYTDGRKAGVAQGNTDGKGMGYSYAEDEYKKINKADAPDMSSVVPADADADAEADAVAEEGADEGVDEGAEEGTDEGAEADAEAEIEEGTDAEVEEGANADAEEGTDANAEAEEGANENVTVGGANSNENGEEEEGVEAEEGIEEGAEEGVEEGAEEGVEAKTETEEGVEAKTETETETETEAETETETETETEAETEEGVEEEPEEGAEEEPEVPEAPEGAEPAEPAEPETKLIAPDPIPEPASIPYPSDNSLKSAKYNKGYHDGFEIGYPIGYKQTWLQGFNSYVSTKTKKLGDLGQLEPTDNTTGDIYHLKSEKYVIDADFMYVMSDTADYYEMQDENNKTILVLNEDISQSFNTEDPNTKLTGFDKDADTNSLNYPTYNISGNYTTKEIQNAAYLKFQSTDDAKYTLIILADDLTSDPPIVEETKIEEQVEQNPPDQEEGEQVEGKSSEEVEQNPPDQEEGEQVEGKSSEKVEQNPPDQEEVEQNSPEEEGEEEEEEVEPTR